MDVYLHNTVPLSIHKWVIPFISFNDWYLNYYIDVLHNTERERENIKNIV
jgi:hypothetical protein